MSTELTMPKLGLTMKTGKVARWLVAEGAAVHQGEAVFEVETDKITNRVESPADGVLVQILVPQGEDVAVGTVLGLLGEPGEAVSTAAGQTPAAGAEEEVPQAEADKAAPAAPASPGEYLPATPRAKALARMYELDLRHVQPSGRNGVIRERDVLARQEKVAAIAITPLARVLAARAGLDICTLTGTGERGKIVKADVERALQPQAAQPETAAAASAPASMTRQLVLEEGGASSFMRTLTATVDMTACLALLAGLQRTGFRAETKKLAADLDIDSVLALVLARVLCAHPALNAVYADGTLTQSATVQLVLRRLPADAEVLLPDAGSCGLLALARARTKAAQGAGTFTLTSYAGSRAGSATPALCGGQAAGLVLGCLADAPAADGGVRTRATLSLGYDARMVNDARACTFFDALVCAAEDPLQLIF